MVWGNTRFGFFCSSFSSFSLHWFIKILIIIFLQRLFLLHVFSFKRFCWQYKSYCIIYIVFLIFVFCSFPARFLHLGFATISRGQIWSRFELAEHKLRICSCKYYWRSVLEPCGFQLLTMAIRLKRRFVNRISATHLQRQLYHTQHFLIEDNLWHYFQPDGDTLAIGLHLTWEFPLICWLALQGLSLSEVQLLHHPFLLVTVLTAGRFRCLLLSPALSTQCAHLVRVILWYERCII